MKRKIVTVGICAIMIFVIFSSGCLQGQEINKMYISIYNRCNEELDVYIYVDGKYIRHLHLTAGEWYTFRTEYDEGRYTEKGYHRIRISTIYHDAGADISEDGDFDLYPGGIVTYNDTQIA